MRRAALAFAALLWCSVLAGCASLVPDELALYGVNLEQPKLAFERTPWQLLIEEPLAAEPVSGSRVVLVMPDGEFAVLPRVRWRENAPEMFRSLLVEAFEGCACVAGAARTSAALRGDYLLASELRRFELQDDGEGAPLAVAEVSLTLVRIADGRVLGSQRIAHSARARRRDAGAGIAALGEAMNTVVAKALQWTHSKAASTPPGAESPTRIPM